MKHNEYIFDIQKRKVIRDFEGAYKNLECVYPDQFNLESPKFQLALHRACLMDSPSVLDVGAGYGVFVNALSKLDIDCTGVDISASAVNKGKEKYGKQLKLYQGDLVKGLDFQKGSFDYVICFGVLTWLLDSLDQCLGNLKHVLKSDGLLAISISIKDTNVFFRDIISNENDFLNLVSKHFIITDFLVHYHEISPTESNPQHFDISTQARDLIVFCRNEQ
ncbi:class I SAM-dependent DNA methyltransferase [Candidatus Nucleicultrix amoebiphila]|jgi:2-polyprenyl-3-methyl-5-hydroxy-6-metoxy-1,4-benzoquinol methylase|uniref:Methyltransferase type 11 domain-containing protein n=1 Tax=Candidatus Nucleicultrix amoebiphila FS5 TaxID=1414854 RepID=A0A1W6N5M1_9PROT|nr:class I SAM-dependent methyltransferase [Candidatus Nucleicultrix amoebiphila]ARN85059.1 hypothetical protein GQ61_06880 [Candidatus Nucleicultrix amoebiphila FS5]